MYWYRVTFIDKDGRTLTLYVQTDAASDAIDLAINGRVDYFTDGDVTDVTATRLETVGWSDGE